MERDFVSENQMTVTIINHLQLSIIMTPSIVPLRIQLYEPCESNSSLFSHSQRK